MKRIIEPEFLDTLPPEDARAIRSRRDLRRVNTWMSNPALMANALQTAANGTPPKQLVELGAGDGDFLLRVARKTAPHWPNVSVTLLDRQNAVSPQTLAVFSTLGWRAKSVVTDVFAWPREPADVVIANLFLHHFDDLRLVELFRLIIQRTRLFIGLEPHRFAFPWPCGQFLWFIGCSGITRHDAVASIAAGFVRQEISALWPDRKNWSLMERRAGLFSHLFIARRTD